MGPNFELAETIKMSKKLTDVRRYPAVLHHDYHCNKPGEYSKHSELTQCLELLALTSLSSLLQSFQLMVGKIVCIGRTHIKSVVRYGYSLVTSTVLKHPARIKTMRINVFLCIPCSARAFEKDVWKRIKVMFWPLILFSNICYEFLDHMISYDIIYDDTKICLLILLQRKQ